MKKKTWIHISVLVVVLWSQFFRISKVSSRYISDKSQVSGRFFSCTRKRAVVTISYLVVCQVDGFVELCGGLKGKGRLCSKPKVLSEVRKFSRIPVSFQKRITDCFVSLFFIYTYFISMAGGPALWIWIYWYASGPAACLAPPFFLFYRMSRFYYGMEVN